MNKSEHYSGLIAALVLSVIAVIAMLPTPGALAAPEPSVRLEPSSVQVKVGDVLTLTVAISDVVGLNGVDSRLTYDTSCLEVKDADPYRDGIQIQPGTFLTANPPADQQYKNQVQNGEILYKATQLFPHQPVSGSGPIAKITFKALKECATTVKIDRASLYAVDRQRLPDPQKYDALIIIATDPPCYTLTRQVSPEGSGEIGRNPNENCPTDPGKYLKDTEVSLTAIPNPGYCSVVWSGETSGDANTTSVRMNRDKKVIANFTPCPDPLLTLTVTVNPSSVPVTVDISPQSLKYAKGTIVTLTAASPINEFVFHNWSGAADSTSKQITIAMDSDKSVTANYKVCYTLTTPVNPPEGGMVGRNPPENCDGTRYNLGTTMTLTAIPNPGFIFERWSGAVISTPNPITITMDSNKNVTANFLPSPRPNGTVSVTFVWTEDGQGNKKSTFNPGDNITYVGVISNTFEITQTAALSWSVVGPCGSVLTYPENVSVGPVVTTKKIASSIYGNACPRVYTFQLSVTHNSVTSSKSTTFTVTMKPGLDLEGYVRLNGVGLKGVKISAKIEYSPDPAAITDKDGYYKFDFMPIPDDAWVTVWAQLTGYTFAPQKYYWCHDKGYELRILDFVATPWRKPKYHVVSLGETLTSIAGMYGVSMWALACANGIRDPNLIYPGQVLVIPYDGYPCYGGSPYSVSPVPVSAPPAPISAPAVLSCFYAVKYGDTLDTIARRFGTDASSIARANGLYGVNWIYAGQRLWIPGCRSR